MRGYISIDTTVDIAIDDIMPDLAATIHTWTEQDKRTFLADIGFDGSPVLSPLRDLAHIIEPFLPDTPERPAKWWAADIADALQGIGRYQKPSLTKAAAA